MSRIGSALAWHGALSFDHILDSKTNSPLFFDANPRLVEPMNARFSGVDLTGALLNISRGEAPPVQPDGHEGVVTKLGLMGLLDAAQRRGRRRDVLNEVTLLVSGAGRYRGAIEELLPLATDPYGAAPLAVVLGKLLLSPDSASDLSRHTIGSYSLTPDAIERVKAWV